MVFNRELFNPVSGMDNSLSRVSGASKAIANKFASCSTSQAIFALVVAK